MLSPLGDVSVRSNNVAGHRRRNQRFQQKPKDKACMHRGGSWIHEKAFGIDSTKNHEDHIAEKGFNSMSPPQFRSQVCSYASSDEDSGCESSSGQRMGEVRKVASVALDQSKQHKRGYSWSTERERKVHLICHHKNEELERSIKSTTAGSCSEVTLLKKLQDLALYSQSKVRLCLKWRQQK